MAGLRDSPSVGFRLSSLDIFILCASVLTSVAIANSQPWIAMLIIFVVGHFFLFCNVFRVSRSAELIWAAVTVSIWGSTALLNAVEWSTSLSANLVWSVLTIVIEVRRSRYHGAWWRLLNPSLKSKRMHNIQRKA